MRYHYARPRRVSKGCLVLRATLFYSWVLLTAYIANIVMYALPVARNKMEKPQGLAAVAGEPALQIGH